MKREIKFATFTALLPVALEAHAQRAASQPASSASGGNGQTDGGPPHVVWFDASHVIAFLVGVAVSILLTSLWQQMRGGSHNRLGSS